MRKIILLFIPVSIFVSCKTPKYSSVTKTETTEISVPDPINYRGSETRVFDLIHTRLDVHFDWEKKYMYGKATLLLKPHFYSSSELILDAKGMNLNDISLLDENNNHQKLQYKYDSLQVTISLGKEFTSKDTLRLFIDYVSKPDERKVGGSHAIISDKGLYFINADGKDKKKPQQIWTQGETESNSCWFPTLDKPNQKMTQEICITAVKKFTTLSNGLLINSIENTDGTRTDCWKQNLPHAPYLAMMAIGEYAIVKDKWFSKEKNKEIEVNYYVEKQFEPHAKAIFGNTPQMLEFYSNKLGVSYPWDKYSQVVVRDYVSGAMENTSAVIHGEFAQRTDRQLLDHNNEDVIAHEVFHHWFGDLVTCESWSNLPLNEAFATYGEYLWQEFKYGRDEADHEQRKSVAGYMRETSYKPKSLIRFEYDTREDMFDGHSYNKGGAVLHMLRKYVGDEAFFSALKMYLTKNKFKAAEAHELRLVFEEVTGEDLNWFFNQWFYSKEHPQLDITYSYNDTAKKCSVNIKQTQDFKNVSLFRIPLYIDVYVKGRAERHKIVITKAHEKFEFPASSPPDWVSVDAERMLLCTKQENKTPEQYKFQYLNSTQYLDRFDAVMELSKNKNVQAFTDVILAALIDKHWSIRKLAISKAAVLPSEKMPELKEKMKLLARGDAKAAVRAAAVEFLSENFSKDADVPEVYKKLLNDKSYAVLEAALSGLAKMNPAEGVHLASELENDTVEEMLLIVASVYAQHGADAQNDFFIRTADKISERWSSSFVAYYSQLLKRCKDETINNALPVFEKLFRQGKNSWTQSYIQKSVKDVESMYSTREKNLINQLNELKTTNPQATGIKKLEEDIEKAKMQKEKLNDFYNTLVK